MQPASRELEVRQALRCLGYLHHPVSEFWLRHILASIEFGGDCYGYAPRTKYMLTCQMHTRKTAMVLRFPERSEDNRSDRTARHDPGQTDNMTDMSCCSEADSTLNDVFCELLAGDPV